MEDCERTLSGSITGVRRSGVWLGLCWRDASATILLGTVNPCHQKKGKKRTRSLRKTNIQHCTFCFSKSYNAGSFSLRTDMCNMELRDLLKHHRVCGVSVLEFSLHSSKWRRTSFHGENKFKNKTAFSNKTRQVLNAAQLFENEL